MAKFGESDLLKCSFCGKSQKQVKKLIAHHTGQPIEKVAKDTDRDFILTAEEAKEYGAIDEIITTRGIAELASAGVAGA